MTHVQYKVIEFGGVVEQVCPHCGETAYLCEAEHWHAGGPAICPTGMKHTGMCCPQCGWHEAGMCHTHAYVTALALYYGAQQPIEQVHAHVAEAHGQFEGVYE